MGSYQHMKHGVRMMADKIKKRVLAQYEITLFDDGNVELAGGPYHHNFPLFIRVLVEAQQLVLAKMMAIKMAEKKAAEKRIEVVPANTVMQ